MRTIGVDTLALQSRGSGRHDSVGDARRITTKWHELDVRDNSRADHGPSGPRTDDPPGPRTADPAGAPTAHPAEACIADPAEACIAASATPAPGPVISPVPWRARPEPVPRRGSGRAPWPARDRARTRLRRPGRPGCRPR